ncbi:MAG: pirin family protein [Candidatus Hodarchaeales archaeon]|jgi:redox-sensitive bicupin YhaK (pirin superfamily)
MVRKRSIKKILETIPTLEGAGVSLRRVFGNREAELLDPFLLMDDFGSEDPEDWIKGFPWHPHRGIETITYVMNGKVKHEDSLGNGGVISTGDIQWMTAGSGIVHQEMPELDKGSLWGFQLWANLPASQKMMDPRYRDIQSSDLPIITYKDNIQVKLISGEFAGMKGPIQDIIIEPQYFDVTMPRDTSFSLEVPSEHTVFNYVIDGSALFGKEEKNIGNQNLIIYNYGENVEITTEEENTRFLLISGKPLKEPIAWYGPIVMNTQDQIYEAVNEYQSGNFIKYKP